MVNYYDGILVSIGLLLLGGAVTALLTTTLAVVWFAAPAVALVGHAMFARPPIDVKEPNMSAEEMPDSALAPADD